MPLAPGTRLGSYEVVGHLGQGGMGEVYRARDTELDRDVALKILPQAFAADPERLARFQREARTLATLNHPNIASIYGLESTPDGRALVMELVDGATLGDLIRGKFEVQSSKFEVIQWAEAIALQITEALEAAHEKGIVHRDLKPANVMVRDDGTVKILDFGLAKAMATDGSTSGSDVSNSPTLTAHTQMGMILGTASYMAPEQARGKNVDKRADIWAFGCVLYEMLTGTRLFKGDEVSDVLAAVLRQDIDWAALPAETPARLRGLIQRCVDRDLKTRLRDIGEARIELSRAADPAGWAAGPPSGPLAQGAPISKSKAALRTREIVAWSLAALAMIAALGIWLTRAPSAAPSSGPVVRTMIPPPDDTAFDFDATVGPAVISPNGEMIAFSARARDGRIQLWVRPLDSATARAIEGTDGAQFPFWSPDSKSIGYYSPGRGRLERVDAAGSAPVEIVKAGFVRGASWGPDGSIAYDASDSGTRIGVVNVAGGAPRTIVKGGSARSPWLLPDGQHLLYYKWADREVRVVGLDGTGDTRVVAAGSAAVYANGKLLFMREDTLLAQSFDLSSRTVSGTPVSIARGVQQLLGDPRGVFSASETGLLLFQDAEAGAVTSLAWFDRDGRRQALVGEIGTARGVSLSPDNQSAVVGMLDAEGKLSHWRVNLSNNQRMRLASETAGTNLSAFLTWAPDGRSIAYAEERDGKIIINRIAAVGGQPESLFEVPVEHTNGSVPRVTAWTKDATTILYASQVKGGIWKLLLKPGAPGGPLQATNFPTDKVNGQNVQLSPNQRWVAYQGSIDSATVSGISVDAYPNGGHLREVTDRGTLPRWSADGKSLFFAIDNQLSVVDVTESDGAIQFSPPRGLMPVIVGRGFSYDVAKDGRILALVTSDTRASRPLTLIQNWLATLKNDK
jgi:eukaryotic-like serine/threonine-protein kinase